MIDVVYDFAAGAMKQLVAADSTSTSTSATPSNVTTDSDTRKPEMAVHKEAPSCPGATSGVDDSQPAAQQSTVSVPISLKMENPPEEAIAYSKDGNQTSGDNGMQPSPSSGHKVFAPTTWPPVEANNNDSSTKSKEVKERSGAATPPDVNRASPPRSPTRSRDQENSDKVLSPHAHRASPGTSSAVDMTSDSTRSKPAAVESSDSSIKDSPTNRPVDPYSEYIRSLRENPYASSAR